jgi:hypothetical protein
MTARPLPRRTVLRAASAAIGLPFLEAMTPRPAAGAAATAVRPRAAFLFVPNGVVHDSWKPATTGLDYALPPSLEPLAPIRDRVSVISGLSQIIAGDRQAITGHARPTAGLLTGTVAAKEGVRAGVSVDQVIADHIGQGTRLKSLELSINGSQLAGLCDSGFSCVYSSVISYRDATTPNPPDNDPQSVFRRIFGRPPGSPPVAAGEADRIAAARRSVLDAVRDDARRLGRTLGAEDRRKLDEYLYAVRDLERRVAFRPPADGAADAPPDLPDGDPADFVTHVRLMAELMALAFRADATRVCTFMLGNAAGNQTYPWVGVPEGHHELSHHGNVEAKLAKLRKVDRFNVSLFAEFVGRLAALPEADGSLLDQTVVFYGSGLGSGNAHTPFDLPVLVAGSAGGRIRPAGHVRLPMDTPLDSLWATLLAAFDVPADRFGAGAGCLEQLTAGG